MNNESDDEIKNVFCCFSSSANKRNKRRKLSQPLMNTPQYEISKNNVNTNTKEQKRKRNSQVRNSLPKEDLFRKFNSVRSSDEIIITKHIEMTNAETKQTYNNNNNHSLNKVKCDNTLHKNEKNVISKDNTNSYSKQSNDISLHKHSYSDIKLNDSNDISRSVELINDKNDKHLYKNAIQQTISSLLDDGNELTSSKGVSNLNVSSVIKDNRLEISSHVISTNKMPCQYKYSSFHKSHRSMFSNASSLSNSCFKLAQFESTAADFEISNESIEGRKTIQDNNNNNKKHFASCYHNNKQKNGICKGLDYQIAKKNKEIKNIKDKINEISDIVLEYEEETQKIIRKIEKEKHEAQILRYMLNFLLNK